MRRYIANYTIISSRGVELINHIITVGDDGRLISIEAFDRELANTCYVPHPLCVASIKDVANVECVFFDSGSREQFRTRLAELNLSRVCHGTPVSVLRLDFAHNMITKI